jgi:hypothetical protein
MRDTEQRKQTLQFLKDDATAKENAATARANAARAQTIVTWTQESERLCQKHKVLKWQFVNQLMDHLESEKRESSLQFIELLPANITR